jgi:hypothetical protein
VRANRNNTVSFCTLTGSWIPTVKGAAWSRDGQLAFLTNAPHAAEFGKVFDVALADLVGGEPQIVYSSPHDECVGDPKVYNGAQVSSAGDTQLLGWS